jgi:hypothetical protein
VTGGSPSSIDGTIRSDIAGANFFFINPSGILFGPNAVVDVSGSFAASSANYLKLADGARFVASLDANDSGLSTAPSARLGFWEPSRDDYHAAKHTQGRGRPNAFSGRLVTLPLSGVRCKQRKAK